MTMGNSNTAASALAVAQNGAGSIQLNNNDDEMMVGDEDEEEGLIFSDSEPPTSH